jgi:shikimate kinase
MDERRPIALIGLMGAGKSAVARALGERLGGAVADLDAMVEAATGVTIADLFASEGEPVFRRREAEALDNALAAGARILACGGGIVVDPTLRARLRASCDVVWLEVTPEQAARRIEKEAAWRPMLRGAAPSTRLTELLAERGPLYAETASVRVPTDGRTPDEVASAVLETLRERAA